MRMLLSAVVGVLALAPHLHATENSKPFCIVALGDSITRGARPAKGAIPAVLAEETFCALLEKSLSAQGRKAQVINVGVPSNRTDQGVIRLQADVLAHRPNIVLIMYGTNDSCYDEGKTGPRLPLETYEKNLTAMIASIRAVGGTPILMTPPPLKDGWGFARNAIYVQKGANGAILPYVEACRRIATAEKVPLIDHFQIWTAQGSLYIKSLLPDGCHPNAAGHRVLAKTILPVVLKHMPPA